ncbi:cytochrome P450 [Sistotremastrum niveocremeum HHB9708]|uniref:Cytochrome P450 n=2 Tax=Sistotremastraceae TaxID=3402574 RepID=A0A164VDA1_9AGAM|nr:cytochrome P450 [Sistotremastrum niveocremeum HHB9708]KZT33856.1 cytochrome P450 [Sistotremastrum suecicum HHB10207 ss-3]
MVNDTAILEAPPAASNKALSIAFLFATYLAFLGLRSALNRLQSKSDGLPFPPGPKGLPLIGNVLDMPRKNPFVKYTEWAEIYGDIVGLKILGKPMVILNTYQAAKEILDKQSLIFSSRPRLPLVDMNSDWGSFLLLLPYGSQFQTSRRFMNSAVNPGAVREVQSVIQEQARTLLYRILKSPEFHQHNLLMQGAIILKIAYGHEVLDHDDHWIQVSEKATRCMEDLGNVGGHPVDLFPTILGKLPLWVWGKKTKRTLEGVKQSGIDMHIRPYEVVKEKHAKGLAHPSMTTRLIDENMQYDGTVSNAHDIAWSAGAVYGGGSDTTTTSLDFFVMAMMLYPEVQKKAQEQLDKLLQHDRLPTFEDMENLPYITALMKETLRWRPIVPAGFPHLSTQDAMYNNMHLPSGTIVLWNAWSILHDPEQYSHPEEFYPEHFLVPSEKQPLDPEDVAFGFGRRVCPGRHLARTSLWIAMASLLTLFEISCPIDEEGDPIKPETNYIDGVVSHPKPFKSVFKPRSEGYLKVLMEEREAK